MPCYHPLEGYRSRTLSKNGKRGIVFNSRDGYIDQPLKVPCGQCIGCRLERSRQWAIRCVHEASLYDDNCFLTLTYDDKHLPKNSTLVLRDFQLFIKKLRKKYGKSRLRYFHCGEYGERYSRPHYHVLLFGFVFPDTRWETVRGKKIRVSKSLEETWDKGFCTIGDVTFESASYVARYITKKLTGNIGLHAYNEICMQHDNPNYVYGEVISERLPEYITMSRRPGIAHDWFEKYRTDVFPSDSVVIRGREMRPPRYYDSQYEIIYPSDFKKIKNIRKKKQELVAFDNTYARLEVKEAVAKAKLKNKKRSYENDLSST